MHVIGTAGHVDHGKSTLVERLTGIDPDRFAEEKRRGLTIDLGFAWLTLPSGNEIGIIDVPGHERFIRNMLAGAGGTTVCLFVVAANEGWKPQSAEHLAILDVLGTSTGVVALTKVDLVDASARARITEEVAAKLGASSLRSAPIVGCSALTGEGLDELVSELDRAVLQAEPAPDLGRPRLWVDRVFTIAGAGTVVTGTLGGGGLETGADVVIAPEGRRARIRSIQSHKKEVPRIAPGNRAALNLAGLERQGARRGDAIVTPDGWHTTRRIHAEVRVLDPSLTGNVHELREKGAHLLYVGTAETPVRVRLIGTDALEPGSRGFAQLELRDPMPLARGDRFVLRDAGRVLTFGGGVVLDPWPTRGPRDGSLGSYLSSIATADEATTLDLLVRAEGMVPIVQARARTGTAEAAGQVVEVGRMLVSQGRLEEMTARLRTEVERGHTEQPLRRGMPLEDLRNRLELDDRSTFEALVGLTPGVVREGPVVRAEGHEVALDPQQEAARRSLIEDLERDGINPPLTKDLDVPPALLRALTEAGEIVNIGDFFLTAAQMDTVRESVVRLIERKGPVTVAELRDELKTSRKYAVPLVEFLDQQGITRRQGNERVLGPRVSNDG